MTFNRARFLTCAATAALAVIVLPAVAVAQAASPFLFTVTTTDSSRPEGRAEGGPSVGERGLSLWTGDVFDPGVTTEVRTDSHLIVRSMNGAVDFVSGGERYATFHQVEVLRTLVHRADRELAVGGGVRQEWGGTRSLIGRVVAGVGVAGGRLEGNAVFEKAMAAGRDQLDLITTLGWSHAVSSAVGVGVEGIGQDLEGFWEPEEAEGGARLLVGPSVHIAPGHGSWSLTVAGGPLLRSASSIAPSDAPREIAGVSTRSHYAVLGSFTCVLSPRH